MAPTEHFPESRTLLQETDEVLLARCREADAGAWKTLVHRYQRLVYAIVRRRGLPEHDAADVFQTVFTRLLENLPRLRDGSRLHAWIVTTASREAGLQHRQVALRAMPSETTDEVAIAESQLEELQEHHRLRLAMQRLDKRCRTLLELLFADNDERTRYLTIQRTLGMAHGAIGPTRARCLAKLRTLLTSQPR